MGIGVKVIMIFYALLLALIFLSLASIVEEINVLSRKIKRLRRDLEADRINFQELLNGKAEKEDIGREAAANLNIRNDIVKLGNRIQKLEKEINK